MLLICYKRRDCSWQSSDCSSLFFFKTRSLILSFQSFLVLYFLSVNDFLVYRLVVKIFQYNIWESCFLFPFDQLLFDQGLYLICDGDNRAFQSFQSKDKWQVQVPLQRNFKEYAPDPSRITDFLTDIITSRMTENMLIKWKWNQGFNLMKRKQDTYTFLEPNLFQGYLFLVYLLQTIHTSIQFVTGCVCTSVVIDAVHDSYTFSCLVCQIKRKEYREKERKSKCDVGIPFITRSLVGFTASSRVLSEQQEFFSLGFESDSWVSTASREQVLHETVSISPVALQLNCCDHMLFMSRNANVTVKKTKQRELKGILFCSSFSVSTDNWHSFSSFNLTSTLNSFFLALIISWCCKKSIQSVQ